MITGEALWRRGYRVLYGEDCCLLSPDGMKLRRDQWVTFIDGERVTAGDLAQRIRSKKHNPSMRELITVARRLRKKECAKCLHQN